MKKTLIIIVALMMLIGMVACTPKAATPSTLNVWAATEPESIDPAMIAWSYEFTLVYHMFDGLERWDATVPGSKPELGDAKTIKWDSTKTKATVTLRDDIYWSDGKKVTAHDYEYAWKRHADASLATAYGEEMADFFKGGEDAFQAVQKSIDGKVTLTPDQLQADKDLMQVKAVDDKTLTFELAAPCSFFDDILAFGTMVPVRQDIIEKYGAKWTADPTTYITNGRYAMSERKPNEDIVCQKNTKYWDKNSTKVDTIDFKLLKDEDAAYAAYQTDQVSFIQSIPLGEMDTALKSPDYIRSPLLGTYYFDLNVTKAPLDNAKVRQALALAIDRNYIVTQVTKQNQIPAYAIVPEGIVDTNPNGKTFRANGTDAMLESDMTKAVAAAKQLLSDAGYPDGKGLPKIELSYNNNNVGHKTIAEAIANMWKTNLGIQVDIVAVEGTVFNSYRMQLKHMIARDGWISDWNDATSMLDLFKTGNGNNHTGWSNTDYDTKVNQAETTQDMTLRSQLLHDSEKIETSDMPAIPLYYYTNNFMLKPYVDGACFSPLGNVFFWNVTIKAH